MYKIVVVGTDGSPTADKAVQAAADMARSWGSELHIVVGLRVRRDPAWAPRPAPPWSTAVRGRPWPRRRPGGGRAAVETYGDGLAGEAHAAQGNADDVILNTAAEVGADLIVVGSKGMRGARRYLGSVPNSVAHGAHCAVLIVKTD